jgi:inorganic pyrophosphatase
MECRDVVIETPKGSAQKYDYDPSSHFFRLKKNLPEGMVFPYDFGFIPGTKAADGDPLDAIVISEFRLFPGCIIRCRIIGAIAAKQSEKNKSKKMIRNDRVLAIPDCSVIFDKMKTIKDLPKTFLPELENFFVGYNKIKGKKFKVIKELGVAGTKKLVRRSAE